MQKCLKYKQELIQQLHKRFRKEYLSQLIAEKYSDKEKRKVNIGDIVLIGDDKQKRLDWALAKIESMAPSRNGKTYVVILKTRNGIFKRPFSEFTL